MSVRRFSVGILLCIAALTGCSSADDARASQSDTLAQETAADAGASAAPADGGAAGPLSGSAAKAGCSYFSRSDGGTCNGYYCGVTEAEIAAAMPADSVCGNPASTCSGSLVDRLSTCTRDIVIANLGTPGAQLRSQIEECVFSDAETKATVKPACLGCFLDSAVCVVDKCLFECSTEGAGCDTCRKQNNCVQPTFGCAQIPNPL